ncbi:hypothetical protein DMH08_02770 [Actinomadura sp. WAC 06369]|nr:hypothetical protein DMH08_02770 [Actinomadura sp. WAC 06369]
MRRAVDERLQARLAENRERRSNRRRRLAELSERRRHGLAARHDTKLARHQENDMTSAAELRAALNDALGPATRFCRFCRINLMPDTPGGSRDWQRYMLNDNVWAAAGMEYDGGWLCIDCVEKRLGRPLTGQDFAAVPLNDPGRDDDTPKLADLKRAAQTYWLAIRTDGGSL